MSARADPRFAATDRAAFASKNLYNSANYAVRQALIYEGLYMGYAEVFHRIKDHEAFAQGSRTCVAHPMRLTA
jgi:hypothetical protein